MRNRVEVKKELDELLQKRDALVTEADALKDETDLGHQERRHRLIAGSANVAARAEVLRKEYGNLMLAGIEDGSLGVEGPDEPAPSGVTVRTIGNPWHAARQPETAPEVRSRALSAVERWDASDSLKAAATATIEQLDTPDTMRGVAAHVVRFSNPLYISAFRKFARDPETFAAELTPDERRIWASAREESRAVLQTSGAVLPSPLDPTIVLSSAGVVDPMRGICRIQTTTSKTHRFITSAGSTFSFDAEVVEVSDDTFTETEVEITNHKAQGFIQASLEVWADQPGFDTEVVRLIADGKATLEGDKFINGLGNGSNEPYGLQTALDGGASELAPTTAETFAAADVYKVLEGVPARFRGNTTFMAELSTLNKMDQFETAAGMKMFPFLGQANPSLLRRAVVENSSVDAYSAVNVAATADHFLLFAGDFKNYVILDRVGLAVAFIPPGVLQNTANNRPDGRVGWYAYWRVGGNVLSINAFRVMSIPTAA